MNIHRISTWVMVSFLSLLMVGGVGASVDDVAGIVSPKAEDQGAYIAARLPVGEGEVVTGFEWYNNDGTVAFPVVQLVASGAKGPGDGAVVVEAWNNVTGVSGGWSTLDVDSYYVSGGVDLYVVFSFPEGSARTGAGSGSGLGIGFWDSGEGTPCHLSCDGENWILAHHTVGLAVGCFSSLSLEKSGTGMAVRSDEPTIVTLNTEIRKVWPNPANPSLSVAFSMRNPGLATVEIYDVSGRLVRSLLQENRGAGEHVVEWHGRSDGGTPVGSGVYFVRFVADGIEMSQRVTLLK